MTVCRILLIFGQQFDHPDDKEAFYFDWHCHNAVVDDNGRDVLSRRIDV